MNSEINLALVGASGVVGKKIISLLEKKNVKVKNFYPLGSSSVGEKISFNDQIFEIESLSNFDCTSAVSYTHLTLPTTLHVYISVVAV